GIVCGATQSLGRWRPDVSHRGSGGVGGAVRHVPVYPRRADSRLPAPCITRTASCDRRAIVPSPTDTPCVGTSSRLLNWGKVARLSCRVSSDRATMLE